jgi:hypothetical protein
VIGLSGKRNRKRSSGDGLYRRLYYFAMATVAGLVPDVNTPTNTLGKMAGLALAKKRGNLHGEHELPNQPSEVMAAICAGLGLDENEINRVMMMAMSDEQVATIEGVSVETVQENRAQVREAVKEKGLFSAEATEARKDLRQDRKATRQDRRARRRASGGIDVGGLASGIAGLFLK